MIIQTKSLREHALAWGLFLPAYAVLFGITLFLGRFVGATWDLDLLLLLNPDRYIPLLDELIILQTDWAAFYLALIPLTWQIGYYASRNSAAAQAWARRVFHVLAVLFGIWYGLGVVVPAGGIFWWGEYEYTSIFLPLGLLMFAGFYLAGNLFVWLDDENQAKLAQAFWLTLLAVFFVNVLGENNIKELVGRYRPLHASNAPWNEQIHTRADEIVRGSYSYISGHTSSFYAQTFIYFMLIKSVPVRTLIVLVGLFHGYTRIYTAAHFPYCVLMATLFGMAVTSLVYLCFWNHRHLPLITMLTLTFVLYELTGALKAPAILLAITLVWFAVYHYRARNKPEPEPLDGTLTWGR